MDGFIIIAGEKIPVEDVECVYDINRKQLPRMFPIGKSFHIAEVEMSNKNGISAPIRVKRLLSHDEVVDRLKRDALHDNEFIVEFDD